MQTKTSNYLAKNINWKRTTDARYPFKSYFEGEECVIRLNEFPDEHMYTLIVDGKEVVSFDDWSAKWNRPARAESAKQAQRKSVGLSARRRSSKVA